jgi:hypothetical protein
MLFRLQLLFRTSTKASAPRLCIEGSSADWARYISHSRLYRIYAPHLMPAPFAPSAQLYAYLWHPKFPTPGHPLRPQQSYVSPINMLLSSPLQTLSYILLISPTPPAIPAESPIPRPTSLGLRPSNTRYVACARWMLVETPEPASAPRIRIFLHTRLFCTPRKEAGWRGPQDAALNT